MTCQCCFCRDRAARAARRAAENESWLNAVVASRFVCKRCGKSAPEAKAQGCARGPCPMELREPSLLLDLKADFAVIAIFAVVSVVLLFALMAAQ